MTWHADITLADQAWSVDQSEGDTPDDLLIESLDFFWAMPVKDGIWPTQPEPMQAALVLNVPNFPDRGDIGTTSENNRLTIKVKADDGGDVIASFYGNVTDFQAFPRDGFDAAGQPLTGVTLSVIAVDDTVSLRESGPWLYTDLEDDTDDHTVMNVLFSNSSYGLGDSGDVDDVWQSGDHTLTVSSVPVGQSFDPSALVDQLLVQATGTDPEDRPCRMILAPLIDSDGNLLDPADSPSGRRFNLDYISCDFTQLPKGWAFDGRVTRDLAWSKTKGQTPGVILATGWGGDPAQFTGSSTGAGNDLGSPVPVTLRFEDDAQAVSDFYAAHPFSVWQADVLRIPVSELDGAGLGIDVPDYLFPDWTLNETLNAPRGYCYAVGIHASDVDSTVTPDGQPYVSGVLIGARCAIYAGQLTLDLAVANTGFDVATPDLDGPARLITIPAGTTGSDLQDFVFLLDLADITGDDFWDLVDVDGGNLRIYDPVAGDPTLPTPFDILEIDTTARTGRVACWSWPQGPGADFVLAITAITGADPIDPAYAASTWSGYEMVTIPSSAAGLTNRADSTGATDPTLVGTATVDVGNGLTVDALAVGFAEAAVNKFASWSCGLFSVATTAVTANRTMLAYTGDSAYKAEVLADAPLWADLLEQTSGTSLNGDYSGNGRGGTIDAGVTFSTAPAGAAAFVKAWQLNAFEGGEVTAGSWMAPGSPAHTAEIWCYLTSYDPDGSVLLARSDVGSGNNKSAKVWAIVVTGTGAVSGRTFSDFGATGTSVNPTSAAGVVPLNTICHVATTWDGTTVRFYVNGTQVATGALSGNYVPFANNGKPITIGKSHNVSGISNIYTVTGKIWGAAFYGTTLTGTRLTAHYNTGLAAAREAIAIHDAATDKVGAWNSSDGWLEPTTFSSGDVNTRFRHNLVHDGTTERKVYLNGALAGTDTGAATRPTGAGDTLLMGVESVNQLEPWRGHLDFIYLYDGVLTDDWIAAEAESWLTPSSFYTITVL